jgi:hypothetical protein
MSQPIHGAGFDQSTQSQSAVAISIFPSHRYREGDNADMISRSSSWLNYQVLSSLTWRKSLTLLQQHFVTKGPVLVWPSPLYCFMLIACYMNFVMSRHYTISSTVCLLSRLTITPPTSVRSVIELCSVTSSIFSVVDAVKPSSTPSGNLNLNQANPTLRFHDLIF